MGHSRGSVMGWLVFGWGLLQITHQPLKAFQIGVMVFPSGKVANVPCSTQFRRPLHRGMFYGRVDLDGKQDGAFLVLFLSEALFFFQCGSYFILNPFTPNRGLREDEQQFVRNADGFFDVIGKVITDFQAVRSEPAPSALVLQVGIQAFGKFLISARIAEKATVVLDGVLQKRAGIGDRLITQTGSAQEDVRNATVRSFKGAGANFRWSVVLYCLKSFYHAQIKASKYGPCYDGSAELGSAEVGSAEAGIAELGSAEVGSAEAGSAEVGKAEVGKAEVGSAEAGSAEVGKAEVGCAEIGSAEVGCAEVGSAEVGKAEVDSAEVDDFVWVFFSPCIPYCSSLLEFVKLFLVCHVLPLFRSASIIEKRSVLNNYKWWHVLLVSKACSLSC